MCKDTLFNKKVKKSILFRGKIVNFDLPLVMGILNLSPDSFFDGGKYCNESAAIERVNTMLSGGAGIIDVGAVSSRPGSSEVAEEDEARRLKPIMNVLSREFPQTWFSVDTFRPAIARMAVEEYGFAMVNDISAGSFDSDMLPTIAQLRIPYIIMHKQGSFSQMHRKNNYGDIVQDIIMYFSELIDILGSKGINDIIIDPGFGFSKTVEQNYTILKNLADFQVFNLPVLAGLSRKSMICKVLDSTPEDALTGTTVATTLALNNGADIIRVHDVKEASETIRIVNFYKLT